ncbi:hypothetical protein QAD02_014374 [Eretmocerus hayati]|uniref:Uncharacterized protein n=1 Tax=Eretmocerus hayati TaxID=131215 RepID=A0ACC2P5C9_9HYME|nr:hypothetical protein QAD02_014374 [Eretmocerus hayati]
MTSFDERRPSLWRLCLIVLVLRSLGGVCRSTAGAAVSPVISPLTGSSLQRKVLGQEIGSPSELAWQAWLLVENKHGAHQNLGLDSSNILRRITPKSIFIAPELSCPSGSSPDGKGGCKLDPIKIDEDAQRQFWLKRLNALYGKQNANKTKKPGEPGMGPLQINIPISALGVPIKPPASANDSDVTERPLVVEPPISTPSPPSLPDKNHSSDPQSVDREAIPVVVSQQSFHHGNDSGSSSQDAVAVVIYELQNNETTREPIQEQPQSENKPATPEFQGYSSHGPSTTDRYVVSHEEEAVVPVTEIKDELNETMSSGMVNYKIDSKLEIISNQSSGLVQLHTVNSTKAGNEERLDYDSDTSDVTSPAVVLLTNPTRLPLDSSSQIKSGSVELSSADPSSDEEKSEENENTTIQMIENETKLDLDSSIQTVIPLETRASTTTSRPAVQKDVEDEDGDTAYIDQETSSEHHSTVKQGDYGETTYQDDLDDFVETEDELLRAGEASMMVTAQQSFDRFKDHVRFPSTLTSLEELAATTLIDFSTEASTAAKDVSQSIGGVTDKTPMSDLSDYTKEELKDPPTTEVPGTTRTTDVEDASDATMVPTRSTRIEGLSETTSTATLPVIPASSSSHLSSVTEPSMTESSAVFHTQGAVITEDDVETMEPELTYMTESVRDVTTTLDSRQRVTEPTKTTRISHAPEAFGSVNLQSALPPFAEIRRISPDELARERLFLNTKNEQYFFKNDAISDVDNDRDTDDEDEDGKHSIPSEFRDQMQSDSRRPPSFSAVSEDESAAASISSPRFAEIHRPQQQQQQRGFARYPSDEVNSIHSQDSYKDHLRSSYRSRDPFVTGVGGSVGSSSSTKSSVSSRLKPVGPNQWRPSSGFGALPEHQQRHDQRQQKQKPMLLRFWKRMPLVRDLSFYPGTSYGSHNDPIGGGKVQLTPPTTTRRQQLGGNHKDATPYESVNRLPSIGG